MPVIFLTKTIEGGGAEKQLLSIARMLAAHGIPTSIFTFSKLPATGRYAELVRACRAAGVDLHDSGSIAGTFTMILRLTVRALRHGRTAVLWTWGSTAEAVRIALPPLWLPRGVVSFRLADPNQMRARRFLLRFGYFLTWRYVSNSERAVEMADALVPGVRKKARIVRNVSEASVRHRASLPAECPETLEVRMLANVRFEHKGYDIALEVARIARRRSIPLRIKIGGRQLPDEPDLAAAIREEGLEDVVSYEGAVADPLPFLASGHVFLLLSRCEGMPNALFEAMGVGLACIASDVGDLRRIADAYRCIELVQIADPEGTVRALEGLLHEWPRALELAEKGRLYCLENLSEQHVNTELLRALE